MTGARIEKANAKNLKDTLKRLKEGQAEAIEKDGGSFHWNRKLIKRWFDEGNMYVCINDDELVGFIAGEFGIDSVMEVRRDRRGKGYGKLLACDWIQRAKSNNICVLFIKCEPRSSIGFWKKLGFQEYTNRSRVADHCMRLEKSLVLPTDGNDVDVIFELFPEEALRSPDIEPLRRTRITGKANKKSQVHLADRFICFAAKEFDGDLVLRTLVDCREIYFAKVKREQAIDLGIQRGPCRTPFFDVLTLGEPYSEAWKNALRNT